MLICLRRWVAVGMVRNWLSNIKIQYTALLALLIVCGSCYASADAQGFPLKKNPVRIINIGDSITQGGLVGRPEYTYRLPLYRMLKQHHVNVDFIGARQAGISQSFTWPEDFDQDHEGFYGATTAQVKALLKSDLEKIPAPDIAIIDLGSNDEGSDIQQTVVLPLREIIGLLRAKNPKVNIVLVQIPGFWQNALMHYHVWRLSLALEEPESPIETVSLYWGWSAAQHTFDGSHPNLLGQEKMAKMIYEKLQRFIPQSHSR